MMSDVSLSRLEWFLRSHIQHYNERKYWSYRKKILSYQGGFVKGIWCRFMLLYIKRCDAFNNASLGTFLGFGATFGDVPYLPHGLYGIVVSQNAVIGKNATIFHQVTIGEGKGGAPVIGDDAYIGAGAKIIGNVKIGNGVKIGAGCVVTHDIPDYATVVAEAPRVIVKGL